MRSSLFLKYGVKSSLFLWPMIQSLVSVQFDIDPERLIADVLELAQIQGGEVKLILIAAHYIKNSGVGVFDSLHAAFCGVEGKIISSDRVFDRLGLDRISLES